MPLLNDRSILMRRYLSSLVLLALALCSGSIGNVRAQEKGSINIVPCGTGNDSRMQIISPCSTATLLSQSLIAHYAFGMDPYGIEESSNPLVSGLDYAGVTEKLLVAMGSFTVDHDTDDVTLFARYVCPDDASVGRGVLGTGTNATTVHNLNSFIGTDGTLRVTGGNDDDSVPAPIQWVTDLSLPTGACYSVRIEVDASENTIYAYVDGEEDSTTWAGDLWKSGSGYTFGVGDDTMCNAGNTTVGDCDHMDGFIGGPFGIIHGARMSAAGVAEFESSFPTCTSIQTANGGKESVSWCGDEGERSDLRLSDFAGTASYSDVDDVDPTRAGTIDGGHAGAKDPSLLSGAQGSRVYPAHHPAARTAAGGFTSSDYITFASQDSNETGDIDYSTRIAASFAGNTPSSDQYVWGKDDGTEREWTLTYDATNNNFEFDVYDGAGAVVCSADSAAVTALEGTEAWFSLAVYHSATDNECGISVGGLAFVTASSTGAAVATDDPLEIGYQSNADYAAWGGALYGGALWKYYILTDLNAAYLNGGEWGAVVGARPLAYVDVGVAYVNGGYIDPDANASTDHPESQGLLGTWLVHWWDLIDGDLNDEMTRNQTHVVLDGNDGYNAGESGIADLLVTEDLSLYCEVEFGSLSADQTVFSIDSDGATNQFRVWYDNTDNRIEACLQDGTNPDECANWGSAPSTATPYQLLVRYDQSVPEVCLQIPPGSEVCQGTTLTPHGGTPGNDATWGYENVASPTNFMSNGSKLQSCVYYTGNPVSRVEPASSTASTLLLEALSIGRTRSPHEFLGGADFPFHDWELFDEAAAARDRHDYGSSFGIEAEQTSQGDPTVTAGPLYGDGTLSETGTVDVVEGGAPVHLRAARLINADFTMALETSSEEGYLAGAAGAYDFESDERLTLFMWHRSIGAARTAHSFMWGWADLGETTDPFLAGNPRADSPGWSVSSSGGSLIARANMLWSPLPSSTYGSHRPETLRSWSLCRYEYDGMDSTPTEDDATVKTTCIYPDGRIYSLNSELDEDDIFTLESDMQFSLGGAIDSATRIHGVVDIAGLGILQADAELTEIELAALWRQGLGTSSCDYIPSAIKSKLLSYHPLDEPSGTRKDCIAGGTTYDLSEVDGTVGSVKDGPFVLTAGSLPARKFNGSTERLSHLDDDLLDAPASSHSYITIWRAYSAFASNDTIWAKWGGTANEFRLYNHTDSALRFRSMEGATTRNCTKTTAVPPSGQRTWSLTTVSKNSGGDYDVYLRHNDEAEQECTAPSADIDQSDGALAFGAEPSGSNAANVGLALFARVPIELTQEQHDTLLANMWSLDCALVDSLLSTTATVCDEFDTAGGGPEAWTVGAGLSAMTDSGTTQVTAGPRLISLGGGVDVPSGVAGDAQIVVTNPADDSLSFDTGAFWTFDVVRPRDYFANGFLFAKQRLTGSNQLEYGLATSTVGSSSFTWTVCSATSTCTSLSSDNLGSGIDDLAVFVYAEHSASGEVAIRVGDSSAATIGDGERNTSAHADGSYVDNGDLLIYGLNTTTTSLKLDGPYITHVQGTGTLSDAQVDCLVNEGKGRTYAEIAADACS